MKQFFMTLWMLFFLSGMGMSQAAPEQAFRDHALVMNASDVPIPDDEEDPEDDCE